MNNRLDHLKNKTSLPLSDDAPNAPKRTQERFSESELTDIKKAFARRFKEAFNHASNSEIARRLGVVDMTVKPYSDGTRLPVGEMLLWISIKSGCSIDWLLTGKGNKRVEKAENIFSEEEELKISHLAHERGCTFEEMVRVLAVAMMEAHEKI